MEYKVNVHQESAWNLQLQVAQVMMIHYCSVKCTF
jgi:hypothetical protein